MNGKQYEHFVSKYGQKHTNCFLQEISAQIIGDSLNMNMNQFSQATALSVGRCHVKGHTLRPELVKNSVYERSHNVEGTLQGMRFSQ